MFDGSAAPAPAAVEPPHPLELALFRRWNAGQLVNEDLGEALSKVTAAWKKDRARVVELEATIVARDATIVELEARISKLETLEKSVNNKASPS